jgi:hypothetical protein
MGTLSIEGYNTEYRGFLPTNDTSKLELIFCCREDPNSTLSQILPSTYPFVLLKVTVIQKTTNKQNRKKKPKQVKKKQKSKQNKGKKKQIKR